MLLPLMMPHIRHVLLGLHIAVSLNGRTTCIWSFDSGFACATAMGYAEFRLLFDIILFYNYFTIIE